MAGPGIEPGASGSCQTRYQLRYAARRVLLLAYKTVNGHLYYLYNVLIFTLQNGLTYMFTVFK